MYQDLISPGLIIVVTVVLFVPILFKYGKRFAFSGNSKLNAPAIVSDSVIPPVTVDIIGQAKVQASPTLRSVPVFLDDIDEEELEYSIEVYGLPSDEELKDWIPDHESVMIKEAEDIVEKIQYVIDNIASSPANPIELASRIQDIIGGYTMFLNTEYYDAINHYIQMAVKRSTRIDFTQEEIAALWK